MLEQLKVINKNRHIGIITRLYQVLSRNEKVTTPKLVETVKRHFPQYREANSLELEQDIAIILFQNN